MNDILLNAFRRVVDSAAESGRVYGAEYRGGVGAAIDVSHDQRATHIKVIQRGEKIVLSNGTRSQELEPDAEKSQLKEAVSKIMGK